MALALTASTIIIGNIAAIITMSSEMSGDAVVKTASSPKRGCRRQPTGVETPAVVEQRSCGTIRWSTRSRAGGWGRRPCAAKGSKVPLKGGGVAEGRGLRGQATGMPVAEAVRKEESMFVDLRSEAEDVHNLARLEPIDKVGELAVMERSAVTDC